MATSDTCGIGGWGGPLPGDPSNNAVLTATPAFGGIDVAWTYPTTNPQAVAYTLLYRASTNNFALAVNIATLGGGFFHDKRDSAIQYFYWIKLVSVNGTVGALIGPASATAKPLIENMIELLTGQIDSGVLATSLKNEIARIQTISLNLATETVSRENGEVTLGQAMTAVNAGVAQTLTFISNEQASRVSGDSALATAINLVAVTSGNNLAAVQQALHAEVVVVDGRVTNLASHVDTVESAAGTNLAQAQTTLQTNINTVNGKVTAIGALYTAKVTVNGLVGGFGVYNDGTAVEAGFDVDKFWIGRTSGDKRKPFIIDGGVVYIDEAAINKLTFSKLRDESGAFIVEGGKVKADFISIKGLSLTDSLGNVIIAAGTALDFNTRFGGATSGVPANNATADLLLYNSMGTGQAIAGNSVSGGTASWTATTASRNAQTGAAYCAWAPAALAYYIAGLDPNPATGVTSARYAIISRNDGNVSSREGGTETALGTYVAGDVLAVEYDGVNVRYLKNGTVLRTISATANQVLYFVVGLIATSSISNIRFGPLTSVSGVTAQAAAAALTANWSTVANNNGLRPADGATVGATFGTNISGQMTPATISAYIANLAVDTLQIAGNAVTIPTSAYTEASQFPGYANVGSGWSVMQTVSFTSSGAPVNLFGSLSLYAGDTATSPANSRYSHVRITRDGTPIYTLDLGTSFSNTARLQVQVGPIRDTPGAGSHTYLFEVKIDQYVSSDVSVGTTPFVRNASLLCLETKK